MHRVIVLGAGKIGALISGLLGETGDYEVQLIDVDGEAARSVTSAHGLEAITAYELDATNPDKLKAHLEEHPAEAVLSSLPYFCNEPVAAIARELGLKTLCADKRAMLYFAQPSTRTYLSFVSACQILGMDTIDVRDTSTSSELKGESPADSVRTFSSYVDMVIMRHKKAGFAEEIALMLSNAKRTVPVVNAGSGKDQHPTQALLDIYTLQRSFKERGGIDGKTVMFTGDLARGRTVRSLAWLLSLYRDVKLLFVAPREFQILEDIQEQLDTAGMEYEIAYDFDRALPAADALYMTRIQDEHDQNQGESDKVDISRYKFGVQHLELLKPDGIVMHPLPRRDEIALEVDADPRAMYWRQVRNGMWMRAALILSIFQRVERIEEL